MKNQNKCCEKCILLDLRPGKGEDGCSNRNCKYCHSQPAVNNEWEKEFLKRFANEAGNIMAEDQEEIINYIRKTLESQKTELKKRILEEVGKMKKDIRKARNSADNPIEWPGVMKVHNEALQSVIKIIQGI